MSNSVPSGNCGTCGEPIHPDRLTGTTCACARAGSSDKFKADPHVKAPLPAQAGGYDDPCPNCGAQQVGTFHADEQFVYGDTHLIARNVKFFRCMACGCEFTGEDGEQKREQAIEDHLGAIP